MHLISFLVIMLVTITSAANLPVVHLEYRIEGDSLDEPGRLVVVPLSVTIDDSFSVYYEGIKYLHDVSNIISARMESGAADVTCFLVNSANRISPPIDVNTELTFPLFHPVLGAQFSSWTTVCIECLT